MTSVPAGKASISSRPPPGLVMRVIDPLMNLFDRVIDPLQRRIGVRGMAYVFVLPNLIIFAIFILFPMLLNFYYGFTGGTKLFPQDRPFVGVENFQTLFNCTDFLNPNTCSQDIFWRSIFNTAGFVMFQVGGMIFMALVTALALNRRIRARGFFRGIFSIRCCCRRLSSA